MSDQSDAEVREGYQLLQSGQLAAAVEYFARLTQRDPNNGPAFGYLGIALTLLGQTDQALAALGKASHLQPQNAAAQYNVAIGLIESGRPQDAAPFLQYTLQLDPNHAQAQAALQRIQAAAPPTDPTGNPDGYPVPLTHAPFSGPVYPASATAGMQFVQAERQRTVHVAPDLSTRLVRGLCWGAAYGQVWTAWNLFWLAVYNFGELGTSGMLYYLAIFLVIFTIGGVISGLVIAFLPAKVQSGIAVGVLVGLLFFGLEMWRFGAGPQSYINIFFWYFTGRFVGANIAARVHRPVSQ